MRHTQAYLSCVLAGQCSSVYLIYSIQHVHDNDHHLIRLCPAGNNGMSGNAAAGGNTAGGNAAVNGNTASGNANVNGNTVGGNASAGRRLMKVLHLE